jgi:hypothetical protein
MACAVNTEVGYNSLKHAHFQVLCYFAHFTYPAHLLQIEVRCCKDNRSASNAASRAKNNLSSHFVADAAELMKPAFYIMYTLLL